MKKPVISLPFICALAGASGCFVDLGRSDGVLRLSAASDAEEASGVEVRVASVEAEQDVYLERHFATDPQNPGLELSIPDLSVPPGAVDVEVELLSSDGRLLGSRATRRLGVEADAVTDFRFEFVAGPSGTPGQAGGSTTVTVAAENTPFVWGGTGMLWGLGYRFETFSATLDLIQTRLLGPPSELLLERIEVVVFDAEVDEDPTTFDDLFDGPIAVVADGLGDAPVELGTIMSSGSQASFSLDPPLDVLEWSRRPQSPAITVRGIADEDGTDFGYTVRVVMTLTARE